MYEVYVQGDQFSVEFDNMDKAKAFQYKLINMGMDARIR